MYHKSSLCWKFQLSISCVTQKSAKMPRPVAKMIWSFHQLSNCNIPNSNLSSLTGVISNPKSVFYLYPLPKLHTLTHQLVCKCVLHAFKITRCSILLLFRWSSWAYTKARVSSSSTQLSSVQFSLALHACHATIFFFHSMLL